MGMRWKSDIHCVEIIYWCEAKQKASDWAHSTPSTQNGIEYQE